MISQQNTHSATRLLLAACDKMQEDKLKNALLNMKEPGLAKFDNNTVSSSQPSHVLISL